MLLKPLHLSLTAGAILTYYQFTTAQKLPAKQTASVFAPANVKIDGRPTEWADKFQAKNSATQIIYVIANDQDNLYLTVQANEYAAVKKIISGGISLVIKSPKDKETKPLKITYPIISMRYSPNVTIPLSSSSKNIDSIAAVVNAKIGQYAKTIVLAGLKDITEPDISIYNDLGIKANAKAGTNRSMTLEYCLPLKYIQHLLDENSSFDYVIILNGIDTQDRSQGTVVQGYARGGGPPSGLFAPTSLKANYTLAKK